MENFISAPSLKELELLAEGHMKAKGSYYLQNSQLCFNKANF